MGSLMNSVAHLDLQVFNHLVKQFAFMLRNDPENIITSTGSRVKYFFKTLGAIAIFCVEMTYKIGVDRERLDAIG